MPRRAGGRGAATRGKATPPRPLVLVPRGLGLADFGRGENYVGRQVERWSKQYRASEIEKIDEMERLMAWLPAHLPPPAPVRLPPGRPPPPKNNSFAPRPPPPRQHHSVVARARHPRGARLGTVDVGRSARRPRVSPDAVAHAAV